MCAGGMSIVDCVILITYKPLVAFILIHHHELGEVMRDGEPEKDIFPTR